MKINGVKNIVVEAHKEGENQPGAEGSVYDSFGEYIRLDAHYNTFNISLTNNERKTLKYQIIAPYDNVNHYIYSDKVTSENLAATKADKFYKWVTFRPTTSKNVLARYPGEGSDKLWTLNELHDYESHPHSENLEDNGTTTESVGDDEEQWYTVFIDEYVYHDGESYNATTNSYLESTWDKYVNQGDRKVELIVRSKNSTDNNSEYLLCKYAFSQRSIQSYYKKVDVDTSGTRGDDDDDYDTESAFGLEHTNESFCLNMRWDENNTNNVSAYNGRYNLWYACGAVDNKWANVIQETVPEHVDKGTCKATSWSHPEAYYRVQKLKAVSTNITTDYNPSPTDNTFYYVNTACMNRNRDLNGDGKIDQSEMKWYNPTYREYVQIMIGLAGLVSPIIDWNLYDENRYYNDENDKEFLHFACSDRVTLWAEEGFSNGSLYTSTGLFPYEIRCARHLGANPGITPTTDNEVQAAYQRRSDDESSKDYYIIDAPYYTDACIRPYVGTFIGPNVVNSDANKVYRHLQVSKNYCKGLGKCDDYLSIATNGDLCITTNTDYQMRSDAWYNSLAKNSICKKYTEEDKEADLGTWRVPNIKELAMIQLLGYTPISYRVASSTYEYFKNPKFKSSNWACQKAFFGQLSASLISRSLFQGTGGTNLYTFIRCVRDVK